MTMMKRSMTLLAVGLLPLLAVSFAQTKAAKGNPVRVALVKMAYVGERNVPDTSRGPDYLEQGGIQKLLEDQGIQTTPVSTTALTAEEEKAYGSWNRLALASGELARLVSEERRNGYLPVGLLGGMPVAIAAGQCLTRMRLKAGLEPALPTRHIVEMCVRDTDPLEQELLDRSEIQQLTLEDVRTRSANLHSAMKRLSDATDVIYIHLDMDALDPREVSGHPLTVPGGPTSLELAAALTEMFKYEKVNAFGVASTHFDDHDTGGFSRQAAYNMILGAVKGVQQRKSE